VERYVSGYAMGVVLMRGGRPVCYHSELFNGEILQGDLCHGASHEKNGSMI